MLNKNPVATESSPGTYERIYDFLIGNPTGVLATITAENKPHATTIYFFTDEALQIYFMTKSLTLKSKNLRQNPSAAIVSFDEISQTSVQITGSATEVTEPDLRRRVLMKLDELPLMTVYASSAPITKLDAGDYVVYALSPTVIRMAIFSRPDPGGYDIFETVEFSKD